MNYRNIIQTLRRDDIVYRRKKSNKTTLPTMAELPNPPSFGEFLKADIFFHIFAGAVFATGHFLGIRLVETISKMIEKNSDDVAEKISNEMEARLL